MAEQLADQSSEERAARTAELKRKMQETAQRNKATQAASPTTATPLQVQSATPIATMSAAVAAVDVGAQAVNTAGLAATETLVAPLPALAPSSNGSAPHPAAAADEYIIPVEDPAAIARRQMNRREFLTYAWGAALGLVLLESGVALFDFMYPRFKVGEFGGKFFLGPQSSMPPTDAPPLPYTDGKFWLVNTTDEGVKALYMVCTHLGCLYKWEPSTVRFECPCHGSKFTREGYYIEGPAPRSLDTFVVTEEMDVVVVDTGDKITGEPSSMSPARAAA